MYVFNGKPLIYINFKKISTKCSSINEHAFIHQSTAQNLKNTTNMDKHTQNLHPPVLQPMGTSTNPIDILDDQQQDRFYEDLLQQRRNKTILEQALLTRKSIDLLLGIVMTKIKGEISTKQERVKDQILFYFFTKCNINILNDHFTGRFKPKNTHRDINILHNAIIVYGVDFLNTYQVAKMFTVPNQLRSPEIKWINDSNVKLTFLNEDTALAAIYRTTSKTQDYRIKSQQEQELFPKGWFQLNPYQIYKISRKLYARYATSSQVEIKQPKQVNRFKIFQNAQVGLEVFLLNKFSAKEEYFEMLRKIQYQEKNNKIFSKKVYQYGIATSQMRFEEYMEQGRRLRKLEEERISNQKAILLQPKLKHKEVIDLECEQQEKAQQVINLDQQMDAELNWSIIQRNENNKSQQSQQMHQEINISMIHQSSVENHMLMEAEQSQKSQDLRMHLIDEFNHLNIDNYSNTSGYGKISLLGRKSQYQPEFQQQHLIEEEYFD